MVKVWKNLGKEADIEIDNQKTKDNLWKISNLRKTDNNYMFKDILERRQKK